MSQGDFTTIMSLLNENLQEGQLPSKPTQAPTDVEAPITSTGNLVKRQLGRKIIMAGRVCIKLYILFLGKAFEILSHI